MDLNYRTKFIDENLEILECIHPSYQLLNEKILKESSTFNYCHGDEMVMMDGVSTSNVKALQTTAKTIMSRSIGEIYHWILTFVHNYYEGFNFHINTSWISNYKKGDYTKPHNHVPASFAFNYFIKTPKESSPLIFTTSGETINAEEGKLIIFPASLIHEVPKNKCDGRIVLSGNIFPNVWENI